MKKIFLLWHNHTIGFCRVLWLLVIPSVFIKELATLYVLCLMIFWLIVKTGYEKKWYPLKPICYGHRMYKCPKCGDKMSILYGDTECYKCGQALDWSDT